MHWIVFHDLNRGWQWQRFDATGLIEAQGDGFETRNECIEDANRHGYRNGSEDDGQADWLGRDSSAKRSPAP